MAFIVISGCGRLGGHLAERFSKAGHDVVIIDVDATSFNRLGEDFSGFTLTGSTSELGVLKKARVSKADLFIASTGNDSLNIMSSDFAKNYFLVPHVRARVSDPELEEFCQQLEIIAVSPITATISPFLDDLPIEGFGKGSIL